MIKEVVSILPLLVVGIPLAFTIAIFLIGSGADALRNRLSVLCTVLTFLVVLLMLPDSLRGTVFIYKLMVIIPEIWFYFRVDQLGLLYAVTATALWLLATLSSVGYMEGEHAKRRYFCFLLFCLAWTVGVTLAGNLFTLFIFYELFSISTYPLVVHEETPEALAAGKKYMIYILLGAAFILFSVVYTYFLAGTMDFAEGGIMSMKLGKTALTGLFWSFILGFGVKAAIMPLHGWVPDAHPIAPSPFSAILSGIMVAVGAFGIMRGMFSIIGAHIVKELGMGIPLAYIICFTIIISSIIALTQDNLKRRLAYSTIGQMGYIILGISLLTPYGLWGGMIHVANHAFMKGTLFLCAGTIIKRLGLRNISEMRGIAKKLPWTMGAFTVAALGMIGLPPTAGFISKWYLCLGSLEAEGLIFVIVLLSSSLLGAAYFLPIVYTAFFQRSLEEMITEEAGEEHAAEAPTPPTAGEREAPWSLLAPVLAGALGVIILGVCAEIPGMPLSAAKFATKWFLR